MIRIKRFLLYTIINYEYKTSELKNVEKLVEQTGNGMDWECALLLYNL